MNILEEIREYFASTQKGVRTLVSLPKEFSAIVIRMDDGYGVAIPYNNDKIISEKFTNVRIYTRAMSFAGNESKYLILSCTLDSLRYEFATVCAQFVEIGDNGLTRTNLIENPLEWWSNWKMLLGNAIYDKKVYSVIAEMIAIESIYKQDNNIIWTSTYAGSHDIESNESSYEVKSTLKRYEATITVAGQHQLKSSKNLELYFCRLEKSMTGQSINDMKGNLIRLGYNTDKLEMELFKMGFEIGSSSRDEKYKVLEKRKYVVDDKFPKIINTSFKNDKIPESVIQITYTIDLEGLEYTAW